MIDEVAKERPQTKRGSARPRCLGSRGVDRSNTRSRPLNARYVTTGDNYSDPTTPLSDAVVAMRMSDGAILWSNS